MRSSKMEELIAKRTKKMEQKNGRMKEKKRGEI